MSPQQRCMMRQHQPLSQSALCLSGAVRTLPVTYESIVPLRKSFKDGLLDIFMFVSRSGESDETFQNVVRALQPVSVRKYDRGAFASEAPGSSSQCFCKPATATNESTPLDQREELRHFSWHGVQFWALHKCVGLLLEHERVRRLSTWSSALHSEDAAYYLYRWIVRARPDLSFTHPKLPFHLARIQRTRDMDPLQDRTVWYRRGHVSDSFALMTRAALSSYSTIWDEFLGGCETLPTENERQEICSKAVQVREAMGTECLITVHLLRFNVTVSTRVDVFRPGIIRPNTTSKAEIMRREGLPNYFWCPHT